MADGSGKTPVVFISRNNLSVYIDGRILALNFPPAVVRDLDLVDKEAFRLLLTSLITQGKITPAGFFLILGQSTCFAKILEAGDAARVELSYRNFCNNVPFGQILVKRYQTREGVLAVAANKELVDEILEVFTEKGFTLIAGVPAILLGQAAGKEKVDAEMANFLTANIKNIQNQILIDKAETSGDNAAENQPAGQNFWQKNRQLILIVAFVLLLLVFGLVLLLRPR